MKDIITNIYKQNAYKPEYILSERDNVNFKDTDSHSTYGEITETATQSIIEEFKSNFNEKAVFYDLGCGMGKMVCHVGLVTGIKSVGIELSEKRFQGAIDTKEKFCKNADNIVFLKGNFLTLDIEEATIVYCDNTVMPADVTLKIYDKLQKGCMFMYRKCLRKYLDNQATVTGDEWITTYNTCNLRYIIKK
jgi:SAM-dependent methyltransferase